MSAMEKTRITADASASLCEDLDGTVQVDHRDLDGFSVRAAGRALIFGQGAQPLQERFQFFTERAGVGVAHRWRVVVRMA